MFTQQLGIMAIGIRRGESEDGEFLCDSISSLAEHLGQSRLDAERRSRLIQDAFGEQPLIDVWIAEVNKKRVGCATSFYKYSVGLARRTFYLHTLFVLPEYRSQGVGKKLFLHCAKVSQAQNCGRMEWEVPRFDEKAINFYRKYGVGKQLQEYIPYRLTRDDVDEFICQQTESES